MGGKVGGSQTIGYHYLFSILFGIGRGPVNELRAIKVGDEIAWEGSLCSDGPSAINAPELFGGQEKEGGIQGPFRLFRGAQDQVLPGAQAVDVNGAGGTAFRTVGGPYGGSRTLPGVRETIGGLVSQFRGVTTLWFDGLISSMNPYPKEWKFRVRRYSAGWQNDAPWYAMKSVIFLADGKIHAMNPAHIIYQCNTDASWGRGLSGGLLDENSFIAAANQLCDEAFGLCLAWQRRDDIDTFIKTVLDHINGVQYLDPETGLIVLKLIRDDYVWADLPVFAPGAGLVEIEEDDSSSQDTAFNEVVGKGHDPITDEDFQLRVHNLAARHSQGAPNSEPKEYPGIPTRDLLLRKIEGDLRQHAAGLKKFNVVLDRSGYKIRPGMVFRIQDPRRGIADITLRAGEIEDMSFKDGRVSVRAVQDVFSLPAVSFVTPPETTWVPPQRTPVPALAERLIEAGYRDLLRRYPDVSALDATDAYVGALAASPASSMYQFRLATRVDGEAEYRDIGSHSFTGSATLVADIEALDITFEIENPVTFTDENVGEAILIGDELMELLAYDETTGEITVSRGCGDTIPAPHALGTRLWTVDDDLAADTREYVSGETIEAVVLTKTTTGTLDPSEAAVLSVETVGRQARPYPPANVQIDTIPMVAMDTIEHPEPVMTWAHRDRLLQEDQLLDHLDASIGPEPGTTYNVRVFDEDGLVLLSEHLAIAGDTFTYTIAQQALDGDPVKVWIELEAERDGLASWQKYGALVYLKSGYGYGYGMNYGGA